MVGMVGRMVGRCRLPDHRMVGRVGPIVYRPALPSNHCHSFHENYLILSRPFARPSQAAAQSAAGLPNASQQFRRNRVSVARQSLYRRSKFPLAAARRTQGRPCRWRRCSTSAVQEPREHRIPTANSGRFRPAKIVPEIERLFSGIAANPANQQAR